MLGWERWTWCCWMEGREKEERNDGNGANLSAQEFAIKVY
jgi:hypothetical protein